MKTKSNPCLKSAPDCSLSAPLKLTIFPRLKARRAVVWFVEHSQSLARAALSGLFLMVGMALPAQQIQWIQLPTTGSLSAGSSGANPCGSWTVANLPCYGNVLITQTYPTSVPFSVGGLETNVPNASGYFTNVPPGSGPYSWGLDNSLGFGAVGATYNVNFYFLNGQPDPSSLFLAVIGLAQYTTAMVSQPVIYRGEYHLTNYMAYPESCNNYGNTFSALTSLNSSTTGGTVGTTVGSYWNTDNLGDCLNTGWALFQSATNTIGTANLQTIALPTGGNCTNMNFPSTPPTVPYLTLHMVQQSGDGIGISLGYVCGSGCVQFTNQSVVCLSTNQTYLWTFCVTNAFTNEIQYLSIPDPPAGVTFSEDIIKLPVDLLPGQGTCVSLQVTNQSTNNTFCFTMGAHNTNLTLCCSFSNCLTLPPCCARFTTNVLNQTNQPNCYTYTVGFRNTSTSPIKYVFLVPSPSSCLTFTPDVITLNPPLPPNSATTFVTEVCMAPNCPPPRCFLIALMNSNLVQCCSATQCLPALPGPIGVASPADGTVFVTPANIPLAVTLDPGTTFTAVSYLANGQVVASNSAAPFAAAWSNAPAGQYALNAQGVDTNGGVWVSDPVNIYVVNPVTEGTNGSQVVTGPALSSLQCVNSTLIFCLPSVAGVTYYIESSTSLVSPSWTLVQTIVGNGSTVNVTNAVTAEPQRFYRVRISQ